MTEFIIVIKGYMSRKISEDNLYYKKTSRFYREVFLLNLKILLTYQEVMDAPFVSTTVADTWISPIAFPRYHHSPL